MSAFLSHYRVKGPPVISSKHCCTIRQLKVNKTGFPLNYRLADNLHNYYPHRIKNETAVTFTEEILKGKLRFLCSAHTVPYRRILFFLLETRKESCCFLLQGRQE